MEVGITPAAQVVLALLAVAAAALFAVIAVSRLASTHIIGRTAAAGLP